MDLVIAGFIILIIGYLVGEWNARRRVRLLRKLEREIEETPKSKILIFVQGGDQYIDSFNEDLNKWLQEHEEEPYLVQMVCANNGRLTVAFSW